MIGTGITPVLDRCAERMITVYRLMPQTANNVQNVRCAMISSGHDGLLVVGYAQKEASGVEARYFQTGAI